ncbi:FAD-dependent monooxygenase [Streptomyces sp. NPDC006602]|uniref:FAD-dependent monooxygenase n=1 Tax=Streptomyces sp. NPDC006602 TaxID=3364751 RepID=UPI00369DBEF2
MTRGRVFVAGGGIGGLATAISLRQQGFDAVVFEQAHKLVAIGAAIGVQTNAVRALREIGAVDDVLRAGVPIEHYRYYSWRGHRLVSWPQGDIGRSIGEPTVVVHRAQLQQALLDALPEEAVRLGRTAVGYREDEDGVTLLFEDGTEEHGELLVGADGLRSVIRAQLLGPAEPRYSGWVALRGIAPSFSHPAVPIGIARQTLGSGRSFGMWHISDGRLYWVATIAVPESVRDVPGEARKRWILERFRDAHAPVAELIEATPADAILRNEIHDRPPAPTWSGRRVTLLGDAAHPTTPVTGQGGGQAIIDAHVLGQELGRCPELTTTSVAEAFAAYEARRRPVTSSITEEARRIGAMHHFSSPFLCLGRDLSLKLTPPRVWRRRMEDRLAF